MDKSIHFSVTQSDIDNGKPGNPRQCPIAIAFKRSTGATHVSATLGSIQWTMPSGNRYKVDLPDKAHYLMMLFDAFGRANVRPADLVIDTPTYYT